MQPTAILLQTMGINGSFHLKRNSFPSSRHYWEFIQPLPLQRLYRCYYIKTLPSASRLIISQNKNVRISRD